MSERYLQIESDSTRAEAIRRGREEMADEFVEVITHASPYLDEDDQPIMEVIDSYCQILRKLSKKLEECPMYDKRWEKQGVFSKEYLELSAKANALAKLLDRIDPRITNRKHYRSQEEESADIVSKWFAQLEFEDRLFELKLVGKIASSEDED